QTAVAQQTADTIGTQTAVPLTQTATAFDHLVLVPATATITAGGSQTYVANGISVSGNLLGDLTGSTTFSISPDGSCSGATCTATTGGKTDTATLTVTAGALDHLALSPASTTITAGGSQPYTAQGFDSFGNSRGSVTGATTFTISPNGSCTGATCSATTPGTHTVTGTDGSATGTATLTVNLGALDHLALSPSSTSVTAGISQ